MLVKSSFADSLVDWVVGDDRSGGVGSGNASRKMRQVLNMEKIVRITWEAAGSERSPA